MASKPSTPDGSWLEVERNGEIIWVHKEAPVWIVHYDAIEDSRTFYRESWHAYRAIERVKRGAAVWSANNKRICQDDRGYRSLAEAMDAAELVAIEWKAKVAA